MAVSTFFVLLFLYYANSFSIPAHTTRGHGLPKSYAAMGDSYPAGAGAGTPGWPPCPGFLCGQYSDAYPIQVANNSILNIEKTNFKNLACGGMTTALISRKQVPYIGDSELVTLTGKSSQSTKSCPGCNASGNDVNFFVVISECVYHWTLGGIGCEAQLIKAREIIETSALRSIDSMISGAVHHLQPGALLIVTGYARFFNEETDYCDYATFSQTRPLDYLTKAKRREFNRLVDMLNDVIKAAAEVHGAVYLDLNPAFEGHRFCEPGVKEPDLERADTWFFNIPPPELWRRAQILSQQPLDEDLTIPGSGSVPPDLPEMRKWRVFHPTGRGHRGISEAIVGEVVRRSNAEQ